MDVEAVRESVTIDKVWRDQLRADWLQLMALSVWGEVKSGRLGAMSRVRRRVLELGEKLNSLCASRDWIPHPREQLKNALGSAIGLKDSLIQLERAAQDVDSGQEAALFAALLNALQTDIAAQLPDLENRWAELLDTQYVEQDDEDD